MVVETFYGNIYCSYKCTDMPYDDVVEFCRRKVYETNKIVCVRYTTKANGTHVMYGEYTGRGDISISFEAYSTGVS